MLRAYRTGVLKPGYRYGVNSRIRESLLLADIAAEQDAAAAIQQIHLRSRYAGLLQEPQKAFQDIMEKSLQYSLYGQGDPVALQQASSKTFQEEKLRMLYHAMLESGHLAPPAPDV